MKISDTNSSMRSANVPQQTGDEDYILDLKDVVFNTKKFINEQIP